MYLEVTERLKLTSDQVMCLLCDNKELLSPSTATPYFFLTTHHIFPSPHLASLYLLLQTAPSTTVTRESVLPGLVCSFPIFPKEMPIINKALILKADAETINRNTK